MALIEELYTRRITIEGEHKYEAHIVATNIEGSMDWAYKMGYEHLVFNTAHGWVNGTSLEFLKDFPWVKSIWLVTEWADLTPLNFLPNLERFGSSTKLVKGHIDFSNVPKLNDLTFSWNEKIFKNFEASFNLKRLNLYGFPHETLSRLKNNGGLEKLEIYRGRNLNSLLGLEYFKVLSQLSIDSAINLIDVSAIEKVNMTLKKLSFENCKRILDFTVLNSLKNLESFYIYQSAPIHSIQFLKKLKNLKYAYIGTEVLDGDVGYLEEKGIEYKKLKKYKEVK